MNITSKAVEELLAKAQLAFSNAQVYPDIQELVATLGYDTTRLQGMETLHGRTNDKYLEQKSLWAEYAELTARYKEKFKIELTRYMDYRKLAHKALVAPSDLKYLEILGISAEVEQSLEGFIIQARHFYNNAIRRADVLAKLAFFSITIEKMQDGLAGLTELNQLNNQQEGKGGEAQRATRERDDLYKTLRVEYSKFREASIQCLRDNPQLREKLEFLERSHPIRKKKEPETPVTPATNTPLDGSVIDGTVESGE